MSVSWKSFPGGDWELPGDSWLSILWHCIWKVEQKEKFGLVTVLINIHNLSEVITAAPFQKIRGSESSLSLIMQIIFFPSLSFVISWTRVDGYLKDCVQVHCAHKQTSEAH